MGSHQDWEPESAPLVPPGQLLRTHAAPVSPSGVQRSPLTLPVRYLTPLRKEAGAYRGCPRGLSSWITI